MIEGHWLIRVSPNPIETSTLRPYAGSKKAYRTRPLYPSELVFITKSQLAVVLISLIDYTGGFGEQPVLTASQTILLQEWLKHWADLGGVKYEEFAEVIREREQVVTNCELAEGKLNIEWGLTVDLHRFTPNNHPYVISIGTMLQKFRQAIVLISQDANA